MVVGNFSHTSIRSSSARTCIGLAAVRNYTEQVTEMRSLMLSIMALEQTSSEEDVKQAIRSAGTYLRDGIITKSAHTVLLKYINSLARPEEDE